MLCILNDPSLHHFEFLLSSVPGAPSALAGAEAEQLQVLTLCPPQLPYAAPRPALPRAARADLHPSFSLSPGLSSG